MMKKVVFIILIFFLVLTNNQIQAQDITSNKSVAGSWLGRVSVGAISLRVVFNLSIVSDDSLAATLDSPDQGARNIKIGPVRFDGKNITISAPLLLAEYTGTLKNDTLIEGTFMQGGKKMPLDLKKLKAAFTLNRPQEPQPPFPYLSEDVVFLNAKANISLAGTLTIPEGEGPFPAVILITGSGGQNRNEEIFGHKPFLVISDYLARKGIAVLRYDDRGVGRSQGSQLNATSADFATDAEAAFLFLKTRKEVNQALIGFAGHSEGGFIAPIIASSVPGIAFIVSLAGTGVPGEQVLHRQNRDISLQSGADEKETEEGISTNKKLFAILKKEKDNQSASEKINETYKKILEKQKKKPEEIEAALKQLSSSMNPATFNWLRYFLVTDPAVYWKKVKCPVLALNGEKDLQVAVGVNLPAIERALKSGGNKRIEIIEYPALNHLFQHCTTGLASEYGVIEETIAPEVLETIAAWILDLQASPQAF